MFSGFVLSCTTKLNEGEARIAFSSWRWNIFSCEDAAQQVLMYVRVCEFQSEIWTVPECFRMFWTVPEFSRMCQTIPECAGPFQNVPECARQFQHVPECFRMHAECSRMHAECSRMFQNACRMFQNACRVFQNVPKCMQIYELACNYLSLHAFT